MVKNIINHLLYGLPAEKRFTAQQLKSTEGNANTRQLFKNIYQDNVWGSTDSISGPGSSLKRTRNIRRALPGLLRELGVVSILDIPCGDFSWMQKVDLEGIEYTGADIVPELAEKNKRYTNDNRNFVNLDILENSLPKADLVLVRDCLVHFSYKDISRALNNIFQSGSTYLLTTTFFRHPKNYDIQTGQWQTLNLEAPPFNLSKPVKLIKENETKLKYSDKALGLWEIAQIKQELAGP